ncbi:hypothetical protein [Pseudoalteromonas rubra]|nr:hypothetical protein [Pseudoalteromonas rubra]
MLVAVGMLAGCLGQINTRVGSVQVECEHNERVCLQHCQEDYISADPLQTQCIQRCYDQANQCRLSKPAEPRTNTPEWE